MIGKVVSHYRILEKLGEGGMGVVYKAQDLKLDRTVALKFLPPDLTRDPEAKERFVHEAKAASALQHNNICTVHDIDQTEDGQVFIVMDFYEGETLKKKISNGPLKNDEAVDFAAQIAQGLAEAHEHGIVHRDIKPANVLVTKSGVAKIVDFGLAKLSGRTILTRTGSTLGTAAYMSPEQVQGDDIDLRADIWSLGVMLHEMITGQLPFKGDYENVVVYSILNAEPEPVTALRSGVPMELERIVNKCLEKDRKKRYQTAADLSADFRRLGPHPGKSVSEKGPYDPDAEARSRGRYWIPAAIILVLAIVLAGIYFSYLRSAPPVENSKSIAVLPFKNLSDSKEDEYFADGITEDIIMQLSQISDLKVISRTSVMQYKGIGKNVREIGKDLDVGTVLEGSVRRAGNQVRIVAQLINAHSEGHIWAQTYDKELTHIFAIQSDVAQKIAGALKARLLPSEKERIGKDQTRNTDAYQLYLKGRFYWNKRRADDLKTAITYFNQAIEKDPAYALAYAGLASTYVVMNEYALLPQGETMPKAAAAARTAMEYDATLAEPHAVLGLIKQEYEWDWASAETEFKNAIDLNPNYPTAHHWYNIYLRGLGRLDEALTEIKRAQELDPLSLVINTNVGDVLYLMRQYDKAEEQYTNTLKLDPNYAGARSQLSLVYLMQGRIHLAIAELQKVRTIVGNSPYGLSRLGYAHARAGKRGDAINVLNELFQFSGQGYSLSYDIAFVYYGLDDKGKTFEWLEKAYNERHFELCRMKTEPSWDNFRSDPRFVALMEKVGLVE